MIDTSNVAADGLVEPRGQSTENMGVLQSIT